MEATGAAHSQVNPVGGAIVLGHPIGATGSILIGTLADELHRQDKQFGIATMCTGLGMGVATLIERMKWPAMIQTIFDPETGISVITWDAPNSPVNIKNRAAIAAFVAAVAEAIENASVKGVIITSAKKDFISGGDLDELRRVRSPQDAMALVREIGQCLRRIETSGKPFVAALNGSAMGGGLEVALACHRRIAVDDPALRLAFPEVTLGLIPGAEEPSACRA